MRRSLAFLLPLSLLGLATFACDDSAPVEGTTLNLDGGSPDVSIPPIAIDGAADASTPTVTVAVQGSAAAKTGVEIVFEYADGTLEAKKTGADGLATSTGAETPKLVTALVGGGNYFTPTTWFGVAGGDVLAVQGYDSTSGLVGPYHVATADAPNGSVAQRVEVSSQCSGIKTEIGATTVDVSVYAVCVGASGKGTLLGIARGAASTGDTGYAFLKAQATPAAAGSNVTLGAWAAPGSIAIDTTSYPDGAFVSLEAIEIADGLPFHVQYGSIDSVSHKGAMKIATGFADAYQVALSRDVGDADHTQQVIVRQTGTAAMTIDLGAPLPALGPVAVTGDPLRPDFTWTGDTAATKGGAIVFGYFGPQDANYSWTFVVPPGTTTVKLPKLPDDAAGFKPAPTSTLDNYLPPQIGFVDGPGFTPASFRAAVAGFVNLGNQNLSTVLRSTPMPANGVYKVTAYSLTST